MLESLSCLGHRVDKACSPFLNVRDSVELEPPVGEVG